MLSRRLHGRSLRKGGGPHRRDWHTAGEVVTRAAAVCGGKGAQGGDGCRGCRLVAGACYVAMHNALEGVLVRRWQLPRQGRRPLV